MHHNPHKSSKGRERVSSIYLRSGLVCSNNNWNSETDWNYVFLFCPIFWKPQPSTALESRTETLEGKTIHKLQRRPNVCGQYLHTLEKYQQSRLYRSKQPNYSRLYFIYRS